MGRGSPKTPADSGKKKASGTNGPGGPAAPRKPAKSLNSLKTKESFLIPTRTHPTTTSDPPRSHRTTFHSISQEHRQAPNQGHGPTAPRIWRTNQRTNPSDSITHTRTIQISWFDSPHTSDSRKEIRFAYHVFWKIFIAYTS